MPKDLYRQAGTKERVFSLNGIPNVTCVGNHQKTSPDENAKLELTIHLYPTGMLLHCVEDLLSSTDPREERVVELADLLEAYEAASEAESLCLGREE